MPFTIVDNTSGLGPVDCLRYIVDQAVNICLQCLFDLLVRNSVIHVRTTYAVIPAQTKSNKTEN